jgi:hypothetical protein
MELDPDPLVRGGDPDPDPQHWQNRSWENMTRTSQVYCICRQIFPYFLEFYKTCRKLLMRVSTNYQEG